MTTNRDQAARRQVLSDLTRPEYIDDYDQGHSGKVAAAIAAEYDRAKIAYPSWDQYWAGYLDGLDKAEQIAKGDK